MDQELLRMNARLLDGWLRLLEARLDEMSAPAGGSAHERSGPGDAQDVREMLHRRYVLAEGALLALEEELAERKLEAPLYGVARRFGLDVAELRILALALAPALDSSFRSKIGAFYRNVLLNYVSVDLCLRLLFAEREERIVGRRLLGPEGALVRQGLVRVAPAQDMPSRLLTDFEVTLPEELVVHLIGVAALPASAEVVPAAARAAAIDPFAEVVAQPVELAHWRVAVAALQRILGQGGRSQPPVVLFQGPFGSGRRMLAGVFSRCLGRPLRRVRLEGLHLKLEEWGPFLAAVLRDCQ
ncbi:MAG: hypothetical protein FJ125_08660, partial [Deltaproteobacteria bacterium]|nr:hypothetical protein [Deltaproteobacteria bacterium]